ncbi:uncharacterized protein LOC123519822 [Portunus trituberculatus]|uniref:uncharacterized protein LOC123519822 n=1 Tax=Portunus trituberculatus TaxID=210409 RepID=UPI001E1D168A|nr:uncharacterized protein LOC123519822 [Portunus trituberculatus]
MLRGAVLLSVLVAVTMAQEEFFEKYAKQKIMTTCFGEELYYGQLALLENAKESCRYRPTFIPGLQHATNTYNIISPGLVPTQIGYGYPSPPVFPTTSLHPTTGYQQPVLGKSRKTRQTRPHDTPQLFVDRDSMLELIEVVHAALSNYTCVLRTINVIDDNLNLRLDTIQRDYYNSPIDPVLRQDLLEGIGICYQLSGCLPVEKTKNPLPPNLQRLLFFDKCEKKQRISNCFKHDVRRNLFRFDLSVLPAGGRVGKLEKLAAILIGAGSLDELQEFY